MLVLGYLVIWFNSIGLELIFLWKVIKGLVFQQSMYRWLFCYSLYLVCLRFKFSFGILRYNLVVKKIIIIDYEMSLN